MTVDASAISAELFGGLVERGCGGVVVGVVSPTTGEHLDIFGDSGTPRPLDAWTLCEVGSVTKVFTGTLLADMVLRGEVALDDRLARFLPVGGGGRRAAAARRVTLQGLATHSAGLPRLPHDLLLSAVCGRDDPYARYSTKRLDDAAMRVRPRLVGRFRYSSFGYALLGRALERAAGAPFQRLVRDRICEPLGLADTVFEPSADDPRLARGHRRRAEVARWRFEAFAPAGGLHSTVSDMLRFLRASARPESTPLGRAIELAQLPRRLVRRGRLQVCLGWMRSKTGSGRWVVWHNGGTGGFSASIAFEREGGSAVAALANACLNDRLDAAVLRMIDSEAVRAPSAPPRGRAW